MFDESIERLIARYVSGNCSAEEQVQLDTWLAGDPLRRDYVRSLQEVWRATGALPSTWNSVAAWEQVRARIAERARPAASAPVLVAGSRGRKRGRSRARRELFPRHEHLRSVAAIAAALLLAVSGGVWWASSQRPVPPPSAQVAMREIRTKPGERAEIYLSDGTHVVLGVASRLRFAAAFSGSRRDVYLEGEALFDVVHNAAKPFAVHTPRAVARDIGTTFDVRAYPEAATEVAVAEGAVALRAAPSPSGPASRGPVAVRSLARDSLVLTAHDVGRLGADGRLSVTHDADVASRLAWTEGRLVFRDAPLREVIPEIVRWYGIDIRLADSTLAARRFTGSLNGESPTDFLTLLAAAVDARVTQTSGSYTLHVRRTSP